MVRPGTTWLCECIIVSRTTVSPESTFSTGACALSNQPHCVVSIVAGSRCTLPGYLLVGTTVCETAGSEMSATSAAARFLFTSPSSFWTYDARNNILPIMKTRMVPAVASLVTALQAMAAAPGDPNPRIADIVAEISPARIEATIRKLVSFGTRNSLSDPDSPTRGIGAARRWIKSELERCARDSGGRLEVAFDEHLVESGARVPKPTRFVN